LQHKISHPEAAQCRKYQGGQQQHKDRKPTTDQKGGYFTGWGREGPGYNKWGATLTDNKEANTGKRGMQKEEIHHKDPVITLTEDDAELVTDKVQDRGEEVVCIAEAQREEIMAKLIEVHETLQQVRSQAVPQATMQQQEKTQRPPAQKEGEETIQIVVQGRETFTVTHQMIRMDQETAQKPMGDMEQFEVVMAQIPTKALYRLQASVMQEVQSRAHTDATNLEVGRGVTEMLQITCDQLTSGERGGERTCR
jgi:hypothetical protein